MLDNRDQRYIETHRALTLDPDTLPTRFGGFTPEQLRAKAEAKRGEITRPEPDLGAFDAWRSERAAAFDAALIAASEGETFALPQKAAIDGLAWMIQHLDGDPIRARVAEIISERWAMPEDPAAIEAQALELDVAADLVEQRQARRR